MGADGTVSFLKPDAPFDNIEYFVIPPTGPDDDVLEIETPLGQTVNGNLTPGTEYPILTPTGNFNSFFDIFFDIDITQFDTTEPYTLGETFTFNLGVSPDLPGVSVGTYTGEAKVAGFDMVSVPEPVTLSVFASALIGLAAYRRRR